MAAKTGTNSAVVKQKNMEAVKLMLYREAPISRAEIAANLGLTPATITNITAELISQGHVEEIDGEAVSSHGTGRKPILIDLKRDSFTVLGVSLGRDSTRYAITDMRGKVLAQGIYEVMNDDYSVMIHQLQGILSLIEREHPDLWKKLLGIGLAIPGVVNAHSGQLKNHGTERVSWCNQPLGEEIRKFTGLPVRVANNVKARSSAISLFWPELLDGDTMFALCYVSFGIACPFVLDNRVFNGAEDAAGEIGKMILRPYLKEEVGFAPAGSLEALSSVYAILKQCRERMETGEETILRELCPDQENLHLSHVLEAQLREDPMVCEIMDQAMFYVGIALANIVDIINPHLVLLSGAIFTNLQNAKTVEHTLKEKAFLADPESLRVVPVDMGEYAGAIGAAACCVEKYFLNA